MLKRIVRMDFQPNRISDFLILFDEVKEKIAASDGCVHLELCKDASLDHVFYTYSIWRSEKDLENYRTSDLFKDTWLKTKRLFKDKPLAYSLVEVGQNQDNQKTPA